MLTAQVDMILKPILDSFKDLLESIKQMREEINTLKVEKQTVVEIQSESIKLISQAIKEALINGLGQSLIAQNSQMGALGNANGAAIMGNAGASLNGQSNSKKPEKNKPK